MNVKKRYFTLVEVLVVIILITMFAGLAGININKAIKTQRFKTEVELVVDTLRLAQDLMLILGIDVSVKVKGGEQIEFWIDVDEGYPARWKPILDRSHRILKEIHNFNFAEQGPFPASRAGELEIRFFSSGTMMSKGVINLSTHEDISAPGALIRAICIYGYPHAIVSVYEDASLSHCKIDDKEDSNLEYRLTQELKRELQNDESVNL